MFSTWVLTPDGWFERRQVALSAEQGRLEAAVTPGAPIALVEIVGEVLIIGKGVHCLHVTV